MWTRAMIDFLLTAAVAGLPGAAAMELALWAIHRLAPPGPTWWWRSAVW